MTTTPFFSVIIPTFNRASLISKAIQSVIDQTYTNWELIIIDDGSNDNTNQVVEKFNDSRIKYNYQHNQERSVARNNGIKFSSGRYICFLDSDDYYVQNRLQMLYDELFVRHFPIEFFYTPVLIQKNGTLQKPAVRESIGSLIGLDKIIMSTIHSQQVCAAKTIFDEFKFDPRFHISEDVELWLRIATKFKITFLKEHYTVVVVEHLDRSINTKEYSSFSEQLRTFRHIFSKEHPGHAISPSIKHHLISGAYHGIAKFHIYRYERWAAAYHIFRALITNPLSNWSKLRLNILLKLLLNFPILKIRQLIDY